MNFNLVLDYFNNKGKDREKMEKIEKALDDIQEYMKTGLYTIIKGQSNRDESEESESISRTKEKKEDYKGDFNMNEIMKMFGELMKPNKSIIMSITNIKTDKYNID